MLVQYAPEAFHFRNMQQQLFPLFYIDLQDHRFFKRDNVTACRFLPYETIQIRYPPVFFGEMQRMLITVDIDMKGTQEAFADITFVSAYKVLQI